MEEHSRRATNQKLRGWIQPWISSVLNEQQYHHYAVAFEQHASVVALENICALLLTGQQK
jgi:uncharacterized protein YjlB